MGRAQLTPAVVYVSASTSCSFGTTRAGWLGLRRGLSCPLLRRLRLFVTTRNEFSVRCWKIHEKLRDLVQAVGTIRLGVRMDAIPSRSS